MSKVWALLYGVPAARALNASPGFCLTWAYSGAGIASRVARRSAPTPQRLEPFFFQIWRENIRACGPRVGIISFAMLHEATQNCHLSKSRPSVAHGARMICSSPSACPTSKPKNSSWKCVYYLQKGVFFGRLFTKFTATFCKK